jgi:hypothetical protein
VHYRDEENGFSFNSIQDCVREGVGAADMHILLKDSKSLRPFHYPADSPFDFDGECRSESKPTTFVELCRFSIFDAFSG